MTADVLGVNLRHVRARVAAACERAGRRPEDVQILPITKMHPPEVIAELMTLGVREVGENRIQELRDKDKWFAARGIERPRWHMVGTLQRNKVKHALAAQVVLIHSVDSEALARELALQAERRGAVAEALLEVNVSGEASKHGLQPEQAGPVLRAVRGAPGLRIRGLMTMAPLEAEPEATRCIFRRLQELRDQMQDELDCLLPVLSMGMSNDFEVAVEEGATLVRLGTVLFDPRLGA